MAKKTIADQVNACWPGFRVLDKQTVDELRHWIKAEIAQLSHALEVLEDESIVGPDGSRKLTDPLFAPHDD